MNHAEARHRKLRRSSSAELVSALIGPPSLLDLRELLAALRAAARALLAAARAGVDRGARLPRVEVPDPRLELVETERLVVRGRLVVALDARVHLRRGDDLVGRQLHGSLAAGGGEARLHVLLTRTVAGLALHALRAIEALLEPLV